MKSRNLQHNLRSLFGFFLRLAFSAFFKVPIFNDAHDLHNFIVNVKQINNSNNDDDNNNNNNNNDNGSG